MPSDDEEDKAENGSSASASTATGAAAGAVAGGGGSAETAKDLENQEKRAKKLKGPAFISYRKECYTNMTSAIQQSAKKIEDA